ncbi:MAG TPA: glutamate racemase [Rhabdochlamydiaceae bacterium]|nr:glutamate racemase [Rhabdochlamydiaceae bacterium]
MIPNSDNPIGVFDSGLGGLTVLKELVKILPHENFLYFADIAHLPYGEKNQAYLIERVKAIITFFEEKKVKLIVMACHTASAQALAPVQNLSSIPILGIIQPTLEELIHHTNKRIAILATKATIDSGIYQQRIKKQMSAELFPIACPLFVPLIEEGKIDHPIAKQAVHDTLKSLQGCQIDSVLLGSTHYPLLQHLIKEELGASVMLIDPAQLFASTVHNFLLKHQLLNAQQVAGSCQFFASKHTPQFQIAVAFFTKQAQK